MTEDSRKNDVVAAQRESTPERALETFEEEENDEVERFLELFSLQGAFSTGAPRGISTSERRHKLLLTFGAHFLHAAAVCAGAAAAAAASILRRRLRARRAALLPMRQQRAQVCMRVFSLQPRV